MEKQQEVLARPRLAVSEFTTYRWTLDEDVYHYGRVGVSALGIWRRKLADFGRLKGQELLADSGMRVSSISWAGGFTGSDGRNHRESVSDARVAVEEAASLDASCLLVHTGARGGHTTNHANRLFRIAIDELLPVAELREVTLAVEPMHPCSAVDWTFLTDLVQTLQWLEDYGHDRLRLVLDLYQWGLDPRLDEMLEALLPYVALVQLGDGKRPPDQDQSRCLLGNGEVPLERYVDRLGTLGYAGYYELELMGEEIESLDYEYLLTHGRDFFARMTLPATS